MPTPTVEPVDPFAMLYPAVHIAYNVPFGIQDVVAYRIEDSRIVAFYFSKFENPETIWQSDILGEQVSGLAVFSNQAYVLADDNLLIWDVKNPRLPTLLTKIPIEGQLFLDAENRRIHLITLINEEAEIVTIDISDPLNPRELGRTTLPWTTPLYYPSAIANNYIVLVYNDYIEIFDISDPNNAALTAKIPLSTNISSVIEIRENLLFVGTYSEMTIIDLTHTNEPMQLSQYKNIQFSGMNILADTAYMLWQICGWETNDNDEVSGGCGYGIDVVDISDPAKPESIGMLRFEIDTNQQWLDSNKKYGHLMYLGTNEYSESGPEYFVLDLVGIID